MSVCFVSEFWNKCYILQLESTLFLNIIFSEEVYSYSNVSKALFSIDDGGGKKNHNFSQNKYTQFDQTKP